MQLSENLVKQLEKAGFKRTPKTDGVWWVNDSQPRNLIQVDAGPSNDYETELRIYQGNTLNHSVSLYFSHPEAVFIAIALCRAEQQKLVDISVAGALFGRPRLAIAEAIGQLECNNPIAALAVLKRVTE